MVRMPVGVLKLQAIFPMPLISMPPAMPPRRLGVGYGLIEPTKSCSEGLIARLAPESNMTGKDDGVSVGGYRSTVPSVGGVMAVQA